MDIDCSCPIPTPAFKSTLLTEVSEVADNSIFHCGRTRLPTRIPSRNKYCLTGSRHLFETRVTLWRSSSQNARFLQTVD